MEEKTKEEIKYDETTGQLLGLITMLSLIWLLIGILMLVYY